MGKVPIGRLMLESKGMVLTMRLRLNLSAVVASEVPSKRGLVSPLPPGKALRVSSAADIRKANCERD